MRRDARRNLERLVAAAVQVFAERGLDAPLEEIAQVAGVSTGTLYNRFGGRDALIDAVMPALIETRIQDALTRAEAEADAWDAFALYVTLICQMQATDLALNDAVSRRFPDATRLTEICDAQLDSARDLVTRAQQAGSMRPDVTAEDLAYLFWSTSMIVRATGGLAPETWRRALALFLDGLRTGVHPLPTPALTRGQVHEAMSGLGDRKRSGGRAAAVHGQ